MAFAASSSLQSKNFYFHGEFNEIWSWQEKNISGFIFYRRSRDQSGCLILIILVTNGALIQTKNNFQSADYILPFYLDKIDFQNGFYKKICTLNRKEKFKEELKKKRYLRSCITERIIFFRNWRILEISIRNLSFKWSSAPPKRQREIQSIEGDVPTYFVNKTNI